MWLYLLLSFSSSFPATVPPLLCAQSACRCRMNDKRGQGRTGGGSQARECHAGCWASVVGCQCFVQVWETVWSAAAHCTSAAIPWALCSPTACSDCTACEIQSFSFKNVLQISPHRLGNSFCHFTPWSLYSSPFKSLVALREENQKNRAWSVRDFGLTFSPCEMPISTACARSAVSCSAFGKARLGAQGQALGMAAI